MKNDQLTRRDFIRISGIAGAALAAWPLAGLGAETGGKSVRGSLLIAENTQAYAHATVKPIGLFDAKITGGYLGAYVDRTREVSVLDLLAKMSEHGCFKNFQIVASGLQEPHVGNANEDEFVYKIVEAAGYFSPTSKLITEAFQPVIHDILAAQDKDGYLNTYYQNPLIIESKGPEPRFLSNNRFELYDFGHFAQGGIAWKRSTGDDRLLKAACKFADLLCDRFGSKRMPYAYKGHNPAAKYEHPNHEMAMVELYRVTGNRRYLDFAAHTLDCYRFWSFPEVYGHCVQENLLLCGGADLYLEIGKPEMLKHLEAMWADITERKMYLTGGVGNGATGETYGKAYELPNATSYCETCAAISKVFFDQRMLLATGQAKYADDLERTFYNAVLCGVSLSGKEYFYVNRMESKPGDRKNCREPYFKCSCCAPNVHRLLGSLQQYLFTTGKDGVAAQLYGNSELKVRLDSGETVHLRETTDYPRSGLVQFEILADGKYAISLRIPQWADGTKRIAINGKPGPIAKAGEYLKMDQAWKAGDKVTLEFDMKIRFIKGRNLVADEKGKVALMRGPLVYCFESSDNNEVDLFSLRLDSSAPFAGELTRDLGGTVRLTGQAWDEVDKKAIQISAIPYHLWANRGPSWMRIWISNSD